MKNFLIIKEKDIELDYKDHFKFLVRDLVIDNLDKESFGFLMSPTLFNFGYGSGGRFLISPTCDGLKRLGEKANQILEEVADILASKGIDNVIKVG